MDGTGAVTQVTDHRSSTDGGPFNVAYNYGADPGHPYRLNSVTYLGTSTYKHCYDNFNDVVQISGPASTCGDGTGTTYSYDSFGRRLGAKLQLQTNTAYSYDALDRRERSTKDGIQHEYSYIGTSELLAREGDTSSGAKIKTYDYGANGDRIGQETSGGSGNPSYHFYAKEANGSVEGLEDAQGKVPANSARYHYDPFGNLESFGRVDLQGQQESALTSDEKENPFRFEGFYFDTNGINTYDMQAREYLPFIGRFLSEDRYQDAGADLQLQSDPLTQNRYAFAGGNPISNIEWDGHFGCRRGDSPCQNRARAEGAHVAAPSTPPPPATPGLVNAAASAVAQQKTEGSSSRAMQYLRNPPPGGGGYCGGWLGSTVCDVAQGAAKAGQDVAVGTYETAKAAAAPCIDSPDPINCQPIVTEARALLETDKSLVNSISNLPHICDGLNVKKCVGYVGASIAGAVAARKVGAPTVADEPPAVEFSRSRAPGLATNFDRAVENGAPSTLNRTTNRALIRANRRAALRGQQAPPAGQSLDEFPFACTVQGGAGACVSAVPVEEQAYQGGVLSTFFQRFNIGEGDPFRVRFLPGE
jgi:RHS repeat-associated protein